MNAEQEWSGRPDSVDGPAGAAGPVGADGPAGAAGSPAGDGLVEVAVFDDAKAVRSASRALLGAGITPTVRVEGTRRFVLVAGGAARDAARVLEVPSDAGASPGESTDPHDVSGPAAPTVVSPPGAAESDGGAASASDTDPPAPAATDAGALPSDDPDAGALLAGTTQHDEPPSEGPEVGPVVDHEGFASVALADDEADARRIGATLMGAGIGARFLPAHQRGFTAASGSEVQVVQVLALEASRALSLLGTAPPRLPPGPAPSTTPGVTTGSRSEPTATMPGDTVEHAATAVTTGTGQPAGTEGTQEPAGTSVTAGTGQQARATGAAGRRDGPAGRSRRDPDEVRSYLGGRLQVTRRRLIAGVLIYLAALVLIPLVFFWATQWILTPDAPDPLITVPGVDQR